MADQTTKQIQDLFVPWLLSAPEYNTSILDKAWAQPDYGRMMLNENPVPPSDKVVNAITEIVKKGNRYPDSMLRLRTKLGALHGVGPSSCSPATSFCCPTRRSRCSFRARACAAPRTCRSTC
jgi:hypothetical protein